MGFEKCTNYAGAERKISMSISLQSGSWVIMKMVFEFDKENGDSFGLILQNLNFICIIGTVESYLRLWGKRVNFGITIAEIQKKYEREKEKGRERKCWISIMWIPKFLCPIPAARVWSVRGVRKVKRKKNLWQLWQYHCRKWEEKNKQIMIAEI